MYSSVLWLFFQANLILIDASVQKVGCKTIQICLVSTIIIKCNTYVLIFDYLSSIYIYIFDILNY